MGFEVILRTTFTNAMDAKILTIIINDNATASLVIYIQPFRHRTAEPIANIVCPKIASVVAQ